MPSRSLLVAVPVLAGVIAAVSCSAAHNGSGSGSGAGVGGASTGSQGQGGLSLAVGAGGGTPGQCVGLQCKAQMDACASKNMPPTTISGTVYDPAGALPLYDIYVYIAGTTPDPITPGNPACTQCEAPASGNPVIGTLTDANGNFTLSQGSTDPWGVPSGTNLTLVLQAGKWRRQITLPSITACTANALPDPATPADKLRLPAKSSEGDMPLIAFTSGCDPAECFLRHIGIDDSEFVAPNSPTGHVHFYTGQDADNLGGTDASNIAGGNSSSDTYVWWTSSANLLKYDIVFNACECSDFDRNMAGVGNAYTAMDDYLNGGGRVFATHYYYNWFAPPTGTADLQGVANWALPEFSNPPYKNYYVDTSFPKGKSFADWLQAQGVTSTYGQIGLVDTRYDMHTTTGLSSQWIYNASSATSTNTAAMYMSFNTPVGHPPASQCGRAVYSDVHLSGTSDDSQFPNECTDPDMGGPSHATNEKALEFLFFDLSSCVQDNSQPPKIPPAQ